MNLPEPDVLMASAARYLIDGQEEDAASVLLSCTLEVWASGDTWYAGDETIDALHVELTGPRVAYDILNQMNNIVTQNIRQAIQAILPSSTYVKHFTATVELVDIDPDWRTELLALARGKAVSNQGLAYGGGPPPLTWKNLRFRSASERRIAEALDRAGVLFLPNCRARLGPTANRKNREADFLIGHDQKWGILEVDGEAFHPPLRIAQEQERDRLFKSHSIRVVEHFDASRCYQDPSGVVKEFLKLLSENG